MPQGTVPPVTLAYAETPMLNITPQEEQLLQAGLQHHQAGRLPQAEGFYRQILQQQPNHPGALHLLGVLAGQVNRPDVALDLLGKALAVRPDFPEAWFDLGNTQQARGQLAAAIAAFRRAIALRPAYAGAYTNMANALQVNGQSQEAIAACRQALAVQPDLAEACNNLGNALQSTGQFDAAVEAYQKAAALKPNFPAAYFNMGNVLRSQERLDEAIACFRQALALQPAFPEALFNLGSALQVREDPAAAIACYQQALQIKPDFGAAYRQLGHVLGARGRLEEAVAAYRQAQALDPECALIYNELGAALKAHGQVEEAIAAYRQYIARQPDDPLGYSNLGAALAEIFQTPQAITCYQRALELNPNYMAAHANLGSAWKDLGRLDDAIASFRRAMELAPDSALVHSKLAYTLSFHPAYDAAAIGEECRRWNQQHAAPLKKFMLPHPNNRDPDRRLRIGYVSPDFWAQAESYFVVPLLEAHDHQNFEIHCYASVAREDAITARQRRAVDVWHDVLGHSDAAVAERVRGDGIDILVDLTMHMANHRLLMMARKPAPVQVAWLAYPGTTGLDAIDYRLTDSYQDPPTGATPCYSEASIRLPDCWVCYDPLLATPPAAPRGTAADGPICFGSLNNPCKINEPLLQIWAAILQAVPNSHLLLLAGAAAQRREIENVLAPAGIALPRVEFVGYLPRPAYLRLYDRIDIALDPLPYNGITTTCDALWMGVPVVSMTGRTAAGRAGLGILSQVGLADLVARTPEEYVKLAAALAGDTVRLAHLRATLRRRAECSPLMDAPRYTRNVEAAFRTMWQKWCG